MDEKEKSFDLIRSLDCRDGLRPTILADLQDQKLELEIYGKNNSKKVIPLS